MKRSAFRLVLLLTASLAAMQCEREERRFRDHPPATASLGARYERSAWAIAEGKRLFDWYNCSGCHAHGGGGMGPPLMDDVWFYGSAPADILASILDGRPNGMPSFRGKLPDSEAWKLVAYVRSLGGLAPIDAAPGRDDHIVSRPSESSLAKTNRLSMQPVPEGPRGDQK
jgi:cytochrome c oxidase cbb3-type subunit III